MIVSIHSNAFEYLSLSPYFNIIQLMGVPTFFLLSSFFFMKKLHVNGPQWSLLLSFIKRIGIMYMIWFVINLPVLYLQNRVHWTLWTFLKDLIFGGVFDGAWFLSALVVSVTLIFLLIKFRVPAFFIGLLCVVIYLCIYKGGLNWISLISTYETYCFKPITLSFPRALIWIFWGYVLSSPQVLSKMDRLSQMNKKHLLVCLLCISIFFMERFLDTMPYHLLLIVSVPLLCIYFYGLNLHESKGWKFLRDCSILFYLIQFYCFDIFASDTLYTRFARII